MILLIDNYDSFTYNLYQYIGIFNSDIKVVRNDKITIDEITAMDPERIVLSPGSKNPKEAGICMDVVREFTGKTLNKTKKPSVRKKLQQAIAARSQDTQREREKSKEKQKEPTL